MTILRDDATTGSGDDDALLKLVAACETPPFNQPVALSPSADKQITLLQPHPDDVALSMVASLARMKASPSIITVVSESADAETRRAEDTAFAQACGGAVFSLGFAEHVSRMAVPNEITHEVRRSIDHRLSIETAPLIAPAAISHHPDHRVVHVVAQEIGCRIFWEDVAFWGIYSSSIDDRVLFTRRGDIDLRTYSLVAVDVTPFIATKAAALRFYRSQSSDVWRPLRYAWTAARELGVPFEYCERFFVHMDAFGLFEDLFGGRLAEWGQFSYGDRMVATMSLP
jgi:LmbE family N-acetylglucosaminyl deacetylase